MTPLIRRRLGGIAVAALIVAADQVSKASLRAAFQAADGGGAQSLSVLPILDFVLTWNRGISYSLGATLGGQGPRLFALLSALIVVVLFAWMARSRAILSIYGLALVIGGALGNLVDRLRFGAVEDFLYLHIGRFAPFGVFNLADSAISVGAVVLVVESLFTTPTSLKNTS